MMNLQGRSNRWTFGCLPRPPIFVTTCGGGHLDEQMQGVALPADTKATIEKQVNEFHLERMNASGKVNNLVYWARGFPTLSYSCSNGTSMTFASSTSSLFSKRSFSKTGHIVRARCAHLFDEHVKELSFLSWNQDFALMLLKM